MHRSFKSYDIRRILPMLVAMSIALFALQATAYSQPSSLHRDAGLLMTSDDRAGPAQQALVPAEYAVSTLVQIGERSHRVQRAETNMLPDDQPADDQSIIEGTPDRGLRIGSPNRPPEVIRRE